MDPAEPKRYEYERVLMGTHLRIALYAVDAKTAKAAAGDAFDEVAELERAISSWQAGSEVRELERVDWTTSEPVRVSADLYWALRRGLAIASNTDGALDITAQPLIALWRRARETGVKPTPAELAEAQARTGWGRVTLNDDEATVRLEPGTRFDFGAFGKGFALDRVWWEFYRRRIHDYLVDFGGDILVGGAPPGRTGWRVEVPGWKQPVELTRGVVASSGKAAQFVEIEGVRYSHILDARTGIPVTHDREVTVIAQDATSADALATALSILDPTDAARLLDGADPAIALIASKGQIVWKSPTWPQLPPKRE